MFFLILVIKLIFKLINKHIINNLIKKKYIRHFIIFINFN